MLKFIQYVFIVSFIIVVGICISSNMLVCSDEKIEEEVLSNKKVMIWYCEDGYILNEEINKCEKIEYKSAILTDNCIGDYEANGNSCVKKIIEEADISYSCPNGYTISFWKYCKIDNSEYPTSKCSSKYAISRVDGECYKVFNAIESYKCNVGTLSRENCIIYYKYDIVYSYVCDYGWDLSGTTCSRTLRLGPLLRVE